MNLFKKERRERLKRPKTLLFFGILFLFLPLINYLYIANQLELNYKEISVVLKSIDYFALFLLLLPIFVGIGILSVQKWGWWLFLLYSILLIIYDIYALTLSPTYFNIGVLLRSIVGIFAIIYFTRKDISAPYFKMYPRGWRGEKRKPIEMEIKIDEKELITKDISLSGFYIGLKDSDYSINQKLDIILNLEKNPIQLKGGVVRIDKNGIGIAFRNLNSKNKEILKEILLEM